MKTTLRWTPVILATSLLAACGGSDPTPLAITTQPVSATAGEGSSVQFSVGAQGEGALTYQWRQGNTAISGAAASTYTFGPLSLYDDAKTFSVTVQDVSSTLASNTATLTVTPRAWSTSVQATAQQSEQRASESVAVTDMQNRVTVAYQGPSGTSGRAAMFVGRLGGAGTLASENVSAAGHGADVDAVDPHIAVDASGRTMIVWTALNPQTGLGEVFAALKGWGVGNDLAASRISGTGMDAHEPDVTASADGAFEVVWTERSGNTGGYGSTVTRRYSATANTWDAQQSIESTTGANYVPRIASDGQGTVWAVWQSENNGLTSIVANRRPAGGAWNPADLITLANNHYTPQIRMDGAGHGVVISSDGAGRVYARLLASGTWGGAQYVANYHSNVAPAVALHASGKVAIASLAGGTGFGTLYHWSYDPVNSGWSAPAVVATAPTGASIRRPSIGFDSAGNEAVLWNETADNEIGGGIVRARRFIAGGMGWMADSPVVSIDDFTVGQFHYQPSLSVAPDGSALAFWFKITSPGGGAPVTQLSKYSLLR